MLLQVKTICQILRSSAWRRYYWSQILTIYESSSLYLWFYFIVASPNWLIAIRDYLHKAVSGNNSIIVWPYCNTCLGWKYIFQIYMKNLRVFLSIQIFWISYIIFWFLKPLRVLKKFTGCVLFRLWNLDCNVQRTSFAVILNCKMVILVFDIFNDVLILYFLSVG